MSSFSHSAFGDMGVNGVPHKYPQNAHRPEKQNYPVELVGLNGWRCNGHGLTGREKTVGQDRAIIFGAINCVIYMAGQTRKWLMASMCRVASVVGRPHWARWYVQMDCWPIVTHWVGIAHPTPENTCFSCSYYLYCIISGNVELFAATMGNLSDRLFLSDLYSWMI